MTYQIHHPDKGYLVKYDPSGSMWSERPKAAYDFDDLDHAQKVHSKLPGSDIIEILSSSWL